MRRSPGGGLILFISALLLLVASCSEPLKIGISKGSGSEHYEQYSKWLKSVDPEIETIDLYNVEFQEAEVLIKECSGLLLSGGPDVHPAFYGKEHDTARCEIDFYRDTLEFMLIESAKEMELPILAICRGEQILNTAYGGTLIVDIPEDFGTDVAHRCEDKSNCFHEIELLPGSLLQKISGVKIGRVNSNHHQAVETLALDFIPTAMTSDGLIEAYEWKDTEGKPFLIAVQWHPERLEPENPLSKPIAEEFLKEAVKYKEMKNQTATK